MSADLKTLVKRLPKAELHLHIEGSLEPQLVFDCATRNGVSLKYKSVEELKDAYKFDSLQSFLDIYYLGANVLLKREDFCELALQYMNRAHKDNVVHTEIFFDPQTHTDRGISFETVILGLEDGLTAAAKANGQTFRIIMCFLRHLSEEKGFEVLEMAEPYLSKIQGVGLDSSEVGHPPSKFKRLYEACHAKGLKCVAHAGEEGPPENIWEAINDLKVVRVDHGVQCLRDEKLVKYLVDNKVPLTVCPNSNVETKVFKRFEDSNTLELLRKGLHITINSDDPAYFGGYIANNFENLICIGFTAEDFVKVCKNSFEASWITDEYRAQCMKRVDEVYTAWKNEQQ
eukprot:Tbor_TRINITY_DN4072_c0_g1::TRINITY_DN4072_c0_g1_i2::g.11712::m.11712/K21053/ade; adenine deaminase